MKRFLLAISFLAALSTSSFASHVIGGEMRYTYLSTSGNSKTYRITLILFTGDATGTNVAQLADSYIVAIYNNDNGQKLNGGAGTTFNNWLILRSGANQQVPIIFPDCIEGAPVLDYKYAVYTMEVNLPDNQNGYTVAYQTCCRISGLVNVADGTGSTYACVIPGLNQRPTGTDSSPMFSAPVNVICKNSPFVLNFSAVDTDPEDVLVYSFCDAWNGGAALGAAFDDPAPPPYGTANYRSPYSGVNPFGTSLSIDPNTGIISGMAPDFGKYVVSVCIDVYRNGVRFASHRKDLIVQVSDCAITTANPMPNFVTCDGFNVQFSHSSNGANTVFWDFGVAPITDDTSNIGNPTYTYADTGTYNVKFVINRGTGCADSVVRKVGVYPGFVPGFEHVGSCFQNAFQFRDTTNPRYGSVDSWRWNFGDPTTLLDFSILRNPQWTYAGPGTKTVSMIVTSTKGCIDSATVVISVLDKPNLTLAFNDTLICIPDAVQLNAATTGTGNFSWTPLTNITNPNTATPTVNPVTSTWYRVRLNENGCLADDSVHVRVVGSVTLNAMADTTICQTDGVQLTAATDGLQFLWSPPQTLSDPTILNPIATPTQTITTYQIEARIGSCTATDNVTITTVPYPVANAGPPQTICYNTSTQLNGSHDGSSFFWTPTTYLNDPTILNPISFPPRSTQYILSSFDTKGCPKPGRDTVLITVNPRVRAFAGRDTTVIVGQPLQFGGTGGVNYVWTPSSYLNNPTIANPIGVYGTDVDSVRYKLVVTDAAGCPDSATVKVTVFKTKAYVFVPTAFTPNNDGLNDVVSPIAVGMQRINYFSIYNRWGQLVFTTTINGQGWDGRINGVIQTTGVFVWMVSAVDYTGKPYFQKGTVALIR